jgi:D-inositol-3-phosphate glycosyltransferase
VTTIRAGVTASLPAIVGLALFAVMWHRGMTPAAAGRFAVLAALSLAVAAWALLDLERFVLMPLLVLLIFPQQLASAGGAIVSIGDELMLIAIAVWLAQLTIGASSRPWLSTSNPLVVPALLVFGANVVSIVWSQSPTASLRQSLQVAELALVVPILFASIPRSVARLRQGLLVYSAVTAAIAVPVTIIFLQRAATGRVLPVYYAGLHKNTMGTLLAAGLVLTYALWLGETRWRLALLGAFALQALGLAGTQSRGAIIGAGVGLIVVSLVLARRRLLTFGLVGLGAVAFFLFVGASVQQNETLQLSKGGYSSTTVRYVAWGDAWTKIQHHLFLGTGSGTYADFIPKFHGTLFDPTNQFLLTWAELGVFGVATLVYLLFVFGKLLARAGRLPGESAVLAAAAGGAALTGFVHFQFDVSWSRGTTSTCFAMVGLMLAAYRTADRAPDEDAAADEGAESGTPVKVMMIVTSAGFAGIERHVVAVTRRFAAQGIDAVVACRPDAKRLREACAAAGVRVFPRVPRGPWLAEVTSGARRWRPDVIHVHDGAGALAGRHMAAVVGARFVRTQHFVEPASVARRGASRGPSLAMHRRINSAAAAMVAVSRSVADGLEARGEAPADRIVVIPPGIEVPSDHDVTRALSFRAKLEPFTVLAAGRLEPEKGVEVLVRAAALVRDRGITCRYVIAGSGSLARNLKAFTARLELEKQIEWRGSVAEMASLFRLAHAFVSPGAVEGYGMATAEAMSWALPVIGADGGATQELVADGVRGMLFRPGDPDALADAIVALAQDRQRASEFGLAGRAYAVQACSAEVSAAALAGLYRDVTRGSQS